MAQVRTPHPNAKLTSLGRRAMVDVVVVESCSQPNRYTEFILIE